MNRRTFLTKLGVGTATGGAALATTNAVAAETDDDYQLELEPGTTVSFAETYFGESFIYAPLSDGSTYYLFLNRNGCCQVDQVVMVLADTGEVLYLESLDGVLYTVDEIGEMADRIGEMADRIVYTEELIVETEYLIVDVIKYTQDSTLEFVDMLNPLSYA
ncbi:twin-arginine translocation signal domain-containing protein [Natronobeatus ordinarius]|uniref:twin-arginine translocation signal domain-containing protein n=1 Tax=Natronobeatus ordinarius TaxID=2963433 RepID=UPI0020CF580C|nr:twin-arginine translocation signal domain-containing protein [Natronobeatus ordinarius]